MRMDGIRHQFLSRSTFPADEDARSGARHLERCGDRLLDRRRITDKLVRSVPRFAQSKALLERRELQTALDRDDDSLRAEWLLDEVEGANLYRLRCLSQRGVS